MKTIQELWSKYNEYSNLLSASLGRTSNIVGEYAEHLAFKVYGGELLRISGASADIKSVIGKRYQVKSRKIRRNQTTQLNVIRSWDFDFLVVILFNETGKILIALEVPVEIAKSYGVLNSHQNGWIITTSKVFLTNRCSRNITELVRSANGEI